jgi:flagellar hook-associated protein 2
MATSLSSLLSPSSSIDLTSILEAAYGSSSPGIDVTSAVNAAVSTAEAPEDTWESQYSTLQSQSSALTSIQTDATNLETDMQSLNSLIGPLAGMTVSSSNSSVVSATAASGSTAGNHVVVVNNLATTASWTSDTVASASTPLAAGSFTITGADGTATTISTGTGTSTLSDVASTINSDNLGVTASVITDANGSRLAIVSNTSGAASNFTVTPGTGLGFSQAAPGGNANLTVDGISIASASNTVTNAIPGVTLNLLSADPGVDVSLGVSPDTSEASTAINQFVSDYNTLINAVNSQFSDSGSGQGVLATDPTVRNLQSQLQSMLGYTATSTSGTISSLASFGISANADGTLTVDSSALSNALQNNFSTVQNFFQGSALNGFANSVNTQLTGFTSAADGAFTLDLQSISSQETSIETDINNFQTNVIDPLQTRLQSEYSQAEILLQELPQQMQQLNTELGYNNSSSN